MLISRLPLFVLALIFVLPYGLASQTLDSEVPAVQFDRSELFIVSGGTRNRFQVEVARNDQQRRRGLMYRPFLDAGSGMLFDFGREQQVAMWMKNTLISLDMLFIAADGRVVNIAHHTQPLSLTVIESEKPVRAVLELNAGTAKRLGIKSGDTVEYDVFQP